VNGIAAGPGFRGRTSNALPGTSAGMGAGSGQGAIVTLGAGTRVRAAPYTFAESATVGCTRSARRSGTTQASRQIPSTAAR
jgi:hypothetical protein